MLIGWYSDITWLLQYQDDTIAMVYNTALSFTILGSCILLLLFHYYKTSQLLATLILMLSFLVILQPVFDINLHVDELFFQHYYNVANFFPGRMAPNTTVSFIMAGLIILIIGRSHWSFRMGVIASVFTILLLFMSLLFASGYISSLQNAYEWSRYTPMALNTALGFILMSTALMFALLYRCQHHGMSVWPAMPVILGLGMFLINSLLALSVHKQQYVNNFQSTLPLIIFVLGTIFTLLFSLLLYYVQKERLQSMKEKKLRALTEATMEATNDGILSWNKHGLITHCNHKFSKLWKMPFVEIKGNHILHLLARMSEEAMEKDNFREAMNTLIQPSHNHNRIILALKGQRFIEVSMQTQKTEGLPMVQVLSFHDITVAKNLETQMIHRNTHDLLTGLPNKALIVDMLDMAIQGASHNKHQIGIFLIDIDKFTQINDVFGRSKGDELIRMIAERLKQAVCQSGILCRLGGDEFIIIAPLYRFGDSKKIIDNILSAIKPSFGFYSSQLNISCAIGAAICPQDGVRAEELLRCIDVAMLRAKKKGRNSFMYYTKELSDYTYERLLLDNELHVALDKKEFKLFYQPLIELKTKKIVGFEALLRWQNPRLGLLTPDQFLSSAEELGLLNNIGTWVLNEACSQLNQWHRQGQPLIKISVNVTAHQFSNNRLLDDINNALTCYKLPAFCLEIELTEQTLIEGSQEVINALDWLNKKQIAIVLDDFGTGYSSLNYIKNFPLDKLKIDKSFTHDMLHNEENKRLFKAIIHLAKTLKLSVLAEGIEYQEQLDFLVANHCIYGQGFFFAKPMPPSVCLNFLKNYKHGCYYVKN